MKGSWVPHDTRDQVVDYVAYWKDRTELPTKNFVRWLAVGGSKFYDWRQRYGKVNEHNAQVPRDTWLEDWEKAGDSRVPRQTSPRRLSPVGVIPSLR